MSKVNSIPVIVYADGTLGTWPEGCTRYIDCNYSFVKKENRSLLVGDDSCRIWEAGDTFDVGVTPANVAAQQTVKIKTATGFLWIDPASYASLKDACNTCCSGS